MKLTHSDTILKQDLEQYLLNKRRFDGLILVAIAILFTVLHWYLSYYLSQTTMYILTNYITYGVVDVPGVSDGINRLGRLILDLYYKYWNVIFVAVAVGGIYLLFTKPDKATVVIIKEKYKSLKTLKKSDLKHDISYIRPLWSFVLLVIHTLFNVFRTLFSKKSFAPLISVVLFLALVITLVVINNDKHAIANLKQEKAKLSVRLDNAEKSSDRCNSLLTEEREKSIKFAYPLKWNSFVNSQLGFEFEYPSEWGAVEESITKEIDNGEKSTEWDGSIRNKYILTFNEIKTASNCRYNDACVSAYGYSKDWIPPYESSGDPTDVPFKSKGVYEKVHFTEGYIEFRLNHRDIELVTLALPLVTKADYQRLKTEGVIEDINEKFANEIKKTSDFIMPFETLDYLKDQELSNESLVNIAIYERILESSKVK